MSAFRGLLGRLRAPLTIADPDRVTREHVIWAYRLFLDRNPENETVVAGKVRALATARDLRAELLASYEFERANPDLAAANERAIVLKELPDGARLFVDLADHAIGLMIARGRFETEQADFVRRTVRPGQVALDLGANVGYFAVLLASRVGPSGRVYAFEPLAANADLLARSIAENRFGDRLILERAAVGEQAGEGRLIAIRGGLNSGTAFLDRAAVGPAEGYQAHGVPVVALDAYPFAGRLAFVKIDVEGAELLAVRGGRERLGRDRPVILTELNPVQLRRVSGGDPAELVAELASLGYRAHTLRRGALLAGVPPLRDFDVASAVFLPDDR